ncbi:hypothetical protein ABE073_16650, partial [Lederbergia citrisecunda]|uniref:hypothetical protein n=1 Tax=Lederbergia citrisecunda TaxID=2833583 RepID=UPI003D2A0317
MPSAKRTAKGSLCRISANYAEIKASVLPFLLATLRFCSQTPFFVTAFADPTGVAALHFNQLDVPPLRHRHHSSY